MSLILRRNAELEEDNKGNQDTAFFTVRGLSLGTASLTFTASAAGRGSATSEPKDIQVYNPLRNLKSEYKSKIENCK